MSKISEQSHWPYKHAKLSMNRVIQAYHVEIMWKLKSVSHNTYKMHPDFVINESALESEHNVIREITYN